MNEQGSTLTLKAPMRGAPSVAWPARYSPGTSGLKRGEPCGRPGCAARFHLGLAKEHAGRAGSTDGVMPPKTDAWSPSRRKGSCTASPKKPINGRSAAPKASEATPSAAQVEGMRRNPLGLDPSFSHWIARLVSVHKRMIFRLESIALAMNWAVWEPFRLLWLLRGLIRPPSSGNQNERPTWAQPGLRAFGRRREIRSGLSRAKRARL